jgi:hypothetical protein
MGIPRKVRQIAVTSEGESPGPTYAVLYALADDGSVWVRWGTAEEWKPVEALPEAPGCNAKHQGDGEPCNQPKGHREQHWNGSRRWT